MIIQQTLKHESTDVERAYLDETIDALEAARRCGDPSGKIGEALSTLRARREELRPQMCVYDQRVHG